MNKTQYIVTYIPSDPGEKRIAFECSNEAEARGLWNGLFELKLRREIFALHVYKVVSDER